VCVCGMYVYRCGTYEILYYYCTYIMHYCTCINVVLFKHLKQMHVSTWTLTTTGTTMEISPGLFVFIFYFLYTYVILLSIKSNRIKSNLSPGMQMQWKPPIWSRQVASLWQGLDMHSLTSISQRGPSYPWRHLHWKEPLVFRQRPPCSQGLAPTVRKTTRP